MKVKKIYQVPQINTIGMICVTLNALSSIKVNEDTTIDDEEDVMSRPSHNNLWDEETDSEEAE